MSIFNDSVDRFWFLTFPVFTVPEFLFFFAILSCFYNCNSFWDSLNSVELQAEMWPCLRNDGCHFVYDHEGMYIGILMFIVQYGASFKPHCV